MPPSAKHMDVVLHVLDRLTPSAPGSLRAPLHKMAEHFGRRGLLVLISDLYEEPDAVLEAVGPLRFRGNDLIVFHLLDPAELDFAFARSVGVRGSRERRADPGRAGRAAPSSTARWCRRTSTALTERFSANRIDYTLVNTSAPLDHALFSYLSTRERLTRVR